MTYYAKDSYSALDVMKSQILDQVENNMLVLNPLVCCRLEFKLYSFLYEQASKLSEYERYQLLRRHPATAARIFDLKQDCLWKYIILGKNKPLGKVVDHWRRIEVRNMILKKNV